MYAIIETGGKQYKVSPGEKVRVEKIEGSVGDKVSVDKVLFIADEKPAVGTPYVEGAAVEAEITKQSKSKKVIVYKYKPKSGYHKKNGHRQLYTELTILSISENGKVLAEYVPAEEEEAAEAAEAVVEETAEEEVVEEAVEAVEEATEETAEEAKEDAAE